MLAGDLFDIEPSHADVNEISRRRLDYGDGWAIAGYAKVWLAGPADHADWVIHGVRGEMLFVRYAGGRQDGSDHRASPDEHYLWVHAGAFSEVTILLKHAQPMPERYWHPNWREINALPPQRAS
jgi:hypothetical protein